jgi:predicted GNAT superfamily acetyltransferase
MAGQKVAAQKEMARERAISLAMKWTYKPALALNAAATGLCLRPALRTLTCR